MWLRKFLDSESASGIYIGWVLVILALFVFLLVTTILLLPFFSLLLSHLSSPLSWNHHNHNPQFPTRPFILFTNH